MSPDADRFRTTWMRDATKEMLLPPDTRRRQVGPLAPVLEDRGGKLLATGEWYCLQHEGVVNVPRGYDGRHCPKCGGAGIVVDGPPGRTR